MLHVFQWESQKLRSPTFQGNSLLLPWPPSALCEYLGRSTVSVIPLELETPNHWLQNRVHLSLLRLQKAQYQISTGNSDSEGILKHDLLTIHSNGWTAYVLLEILPLWEHWSPVPRFLPVLSTGACAASLLSCETAAHHMPFSERGWWSILRGPCSPMHV